MGSHPRSSYAVISSPLISCRRARIVAGAGSSSPAVNSLTLLARSSRSWRRPRMPASFAASIAGRARGHIRSFSPF